MFCPNCGIQAPESGAFCATCGNRLRHPGKHGRDRILKQLASDVRFMRGGNIPWKLVGYPALVVLALVGIASFIGLVFSLLEGVGAHR